MLKFDFWVANWPLAINSKFFKDFLEISEFPKILSLQWFGNSWGNLYIYLSLIIIYEIDSLVGKENCAKTWISLQMFCHDCLKIFLLVCNSLKMRGNSKSDHFVVENSKTFSQTLPCCTWNGFYYQISTWHQRSGFWNISNLGHCWSSIAPNMSFKSEWNFWSTIIYRKFKFLGVWIELEIKICFLRQPWTKYCRQIHIIK